MVQSHFKLVESRSQLGSTTCWMLGKESSEVEEKTRVATANHNRSKVSHSVSVFRNYLLIRQQPLQITLRSILWMSVVTISVESGKLKLELFSYFTIGIDRRKFILVVLYSTIRGPSTERRDIGDLAIFSHAERRKWLWSIVIVILCKPAGVTSSRQCRLS
jgi:hypothetical protein